MNGRNSAVGGRPSILDDSDSRLLERFVSQREEAAFAALMARHGPMVFGVCRRMLQHAHEAEDAFQATFLVLVRKAAAIRNRELLGPWLYGVACRVAARARLLAARRRMHEGGDMDAALTPPSQSVGLSDATEAVVEEVGRLPAKYRCPVVLCHLEGRTHEEAAEELCWPVGTVKGRLARAREMLRQRLLRRGLAPSAMAVAVALSSEGLASPSPILAGSTLKAAMCFAAGDAAGGIVSAPVAALTKGVLHTMFVTKAKTVAALVMAVAVLVGGSAALAYYTLKAKPEKKTDQEKILGAWKVDSAKANGEEPQGDEGERIKGATWTISRDKITVTFNGEDRVSSYKLDPTANPRALDIMTEKEGDFKGIYKLDGDTLTICATLGGGERPTEFASTAGSSTMLIVLKRKT